MIVEFNRQSKIINQQNPSAFGPESFAQVLVAGVADDVDHYRLLPSLQIKIAGDFQASDDGGSGGDAYQQSGVAREVARHGIGVFRGNFEILIGQVRVVDFRNNRAGHVLGAFYSVKRGVGLERDALHSGIQFFQPARGSDKR